MKTRMKTLAGLLLAIIAVTGCSEEATKPGAAGSEPPALPPVESLTFDLSLFETEGSKTRPRAESGGAEAAFAKWNWFNAAARVAIVNIVAVAIVAPPAAAFHAAVHTFPSYIGDNTWVWIYTWTDGQGHDVQIRLKGTVVPENDLVEWEMRVTDSQADPPLDQALWFHGESHIVAEEGYWVLNDLEAAGQPEAARIDWAVEAPYDRRLRFENIYAGHEGVGDTLEYSVEDRIIRVVFFDLSEDLATTIQWDRVSGAGWLLAPDYNDGEKACWDEDQNDTECPDDDPV